MLCRFCRSSTQVLKSVTNASGTEVVRFRRCLSDPKHRFKTTESQKAPTLTDVAVRQTGSGKLAGAFDFDRLVRDIEGAVLQLGGKDSHLIVTMIALRAVSFLERRLPELAKPLTKDERRQFPELASYIMDTHISDEVEAQLGRMKIRLASVLYALSIRGRADRAGRQGWQTAEDVLSWLYEIHPKLKQDIPPTVHVPTEVWTPVGRMPVPHHVIKKAHRQLLPVNDDGKSHKVARSKRIDHAMESEFLWPRGGEALGDNAVLAGWSEESRLLRRFDLDQFEGSIRKAMMGRPDSEAKSKAVARWVLQSIGGQPIVLTTQLAAGVLQCLRRVDDIAYLRWATVAKSFDNVTVFAEEAMALLTDPSPKLEFPAAPNSN